eukprot:scaffold33505_cov101-Skeletonema_dohrnii-CCMP3373.AAC.6
MSYNFALHYNLLITGARSIQPAGAEIVLKILISLQTVLEESVARRTARVPNAWEGIVTRMAQVTPNALEECRQRNAKGSASCSEKCDQTGAEISSCIDSEGCARLSVQESRYLGLIKIKPLA